MDFSLHASIRAMLQHRCVLPACLAIAGALPLSAQIQPSGDVKVPSFTLPYSTFASEEAKQAFIERINTPLPARHDVASLRAFYGRYNDRLADRMRKSYAVDVHEETWDGVKVMRVTPKEGVKSSHRGQVLMNLHGGALMWGSGAGELVEAAPVAATEGIEVVSVDYPLAPEFTLPVAIEGITKVYRHLLTHYAARSIGIYGCSAGAILAGESVAHFIAAKLPVPGALGVFCGALYPFEGDSVLVAPASMKEPLTSSQGADVASNAFFRGVDAHSPSVFPGYSPALLQHFPPTLLLTATRDQAFSSVIESEVALHQAGVPTQMHVWDGLWHAFFVDPDLPESREAYDDIATFFDKTLAPGAAQKEAK